MSAYDRWQGEDFLPLGLAWTDDILASIDRRRLGDPTWSRVRPWGCVVTVPADGGTVWFRILDPDPWNAERDLGSLGLAATPEAEESAARGGLGQRRDVVAHDLACLDRLITTTR